MEKNEKVFKIDDESVVFLPEDEINPPSKSLAENSIIELDSITEKNNDYLLIGIYGNGSGLLKASFFNEMKTQKNAFKIKFMYQGKDLLKKKVLAAELYQIQVNSKHILILLTKNGFIDDNKKYIVDYFKDNKITFKETIIFESIFTKDLIYSSEVKNECFYIKGRNCKLPTGNLKKLPPPNSIGGFAGFFMNWADFNDMPCILLISVFNYYDIGLESARVYSEGTKEYEFLKGKIDDNYLKTNNIDINCLNSVFNEFNYLKKTYFS